MNSLYIIIIVLASIDFCLTGFWIWRWHFSSCVKKFKYKLPLKLIEANPVIRNTIEAMGFTQGLLMGYAIIFVIQLALTKLHIVLGYVVIIVLTLAILSHLRNNYITSNDHIITMTKEYNQRIKVVKGDGEV